MTRLQESQFSCSADLNEILVWGINPMKHLLELMDAYIEENLDDEDEEVMFFFRYEFEDKINGIEEAIYRFINAAKKRRRKLPLKETGSLQDLINGQQEKAPDTSHKDTGA